MERPMRKMNPDITNKAEEDVKPNQTNNKICQINHIQWAMLHFRHNSQNPLAIKIYYQLMQLYIITIFYVTFRN